jgi:hypothetical protein
VTGGSVVYLLFMAASLLRRFSPVLIALAASACPKTRSPPAASFPSSQASPRSIVVSRQTCALEPLRTSGRIHFVCDCQAGADKKCVPGSDSNNGLAPSTPLRSFPKAADAFATMNAGDTVAFCRGGRWNLAGGAGWANRHCRKGNTCDVRDYRPPWGTGGEAKPSIWLDGGDAGSTLMSFIHPAEHFEGYRVLNLDLHGARADVAIFFFNETTDVDLCNLSTDGFGISVQIAGGDSPSFGICSKVVLRQSHITNNANIAYLAVCDDCSVEDNVFDNNGARDVLTHTIYFASQVFRVNGRPVVHTSHGMRLSHNEIHYSSQPCLGAPVVVHGRHEDTVIENNLIEAARAGEQCWGPGVGCGGYLYGCWFRNAIIRGNVFKNLGNVASDNSNCVGCTIENNLFLMNRDGTAISLGGNRPRPAGDPSYSQSDGQLDEPTSSAVIRNNTFYFGDTVTSAAAITAFSGTGHVIENNAIAFGTGKTSHNACYRLAGDANKLLAGADHNVCNLPAGGVWIDQPPDQELSLARWQALGFDKHSRQSDPLFSNPPASFLPAPGSPLIGGAERSNCPKDDLVHKPRDLQPDIGAYER